MQEYQNKKSIGQCLSSTYLFEKHLKQQQQQQNMCFSISGADKQGKCFEDSLRVKVVKNLGIIWMYKYWIGLYY